MIVGFAKAMRQKMTSLNIQKDAIDVCGTGGSGKDRFNVHCIGICIIKHGSSRHKTWESWLKKTNGSFDFLEALGLPIELMPTHVRAFSVHAALLCLCTMFQRRRKSCGCQKGHWSPDYFQFYSVHCTAHQM